MQAIAEVVSPVHLYTRHRKRVYRWTGDTTTKKVRKLVIMTPEQFRQLALSFPGTLEAAHFERTAFKSMGKGIFATLQTTTQTVNLPLSLVDQASFAALAPGCIFPVPNKWGEKGWTTFEITKLDQAIVTAALEAAYRDALQAKTRKK